MDKNSQWLWTCLSAGRKDEAVEVGKGNADELRLAALVGAHGDVAFQEQSAFVPTVLHTSLEVGSEHTISSTSEAGVDNSAEGGPSLLTVQAAAATVLAC